MSFKTGTHNKYFYTWQSHYTLSDDRFYSYFCTGFSPVGVVGRLTQEWVPAPKVRLLSLPFPILFIFFLILLTPSIIAVGQWMEEDTDLPRTGAESLGEVISSKIHSFISRWPLPFHPLDFRCSCLEGPCKTLTRSVKTADVWWQWF